MYLLCTQLYVYQAYVQWDVPVCIGRKTRNKPNHENKSQDCVNTFVSHENTNLSVLYVFILYPGSGKDQRKRCAHISAGSTGHLCVHRSPDRVHC